MPVMDLDDCQFLHGRRFRRYTADIAKHYSHYHGLQVMSAGAVRIAYGLRDQGERELRGAWLWPTYPGPLISFRPAVDPGWWDHQYIAFTGAQVQRWQAEGIFPTEPQEIADLTDFVPRFRAALQLLQRREHWPTRRGFNLVQQLLLELAEARAQPQRREAWLETVLLALQPDASGTPSAEALARQAGMAASTLRRRFREAMGMSISEHALSLRMTEACHLLATTDEAVGTIADRLGYSDIYFFSRQFRGRVGVSPTAYRRSKR